MLGYDHRLLNGFYFNEKSVLMNIGIFIYSCNLSITLLLAVIQIKLYYTWFILPLVAMDRNATLTELRVFDPTRYYREFHPCDVVVVANVLTDSFNN